VLAATGCTVGGGPTPLATATNLAVVQSLHDELPQAIKDAGVIRFAGDSHPPYRTVGADGVTVTGIDADFQAAIGQVLGVKTQTVVVAGLPVALQGMLGNRYDAFNGPVKATAEREKQFDTITWMTTRTAYVVPVDSAGITRPEDLCGKRIAVVTGSVVEEQLTKLSQFCTQNRHSATQAIGLDDTNATLLATRSGRADAAGMTEAAAIDVTQKQGAYKYVTQTEEQGATKDDLAMYVPKSSKLGPVLQKVFEELFQNGTYVGIMSRWGLNRVSVPQPVLNAASRG
jgi:polar amino acid transport system substrate-binding protein